MGYITEVMAQALKDSINGIVQPVEPYNEAKGEPMNPDSGHLVGSRFMEAMLEAKLAGYEPLPSVLDHAAKVKLAGREEAHVSLTSGGKLSRWAAQRRKARRKMEKESRRQNRR